MVEKKHPFDPEQWYAETIWGNQIVNDDALFEIMSLQIFQAGLSWSMVVKKVHAFRHAFRNWDINIVANFRNEDIQRLCSDQGIIRNKLKIEATIHNAKKVLDLQEEYGSFTHWFYNVLEGETYPSLQKKISTHFKFMGPELCRMWLMAVGRISLEEGNKYRPSGAPKYGNSLEVL